MPIITHTDYNKKNNLDAIITQDDRINTIDDTKEMSSTNTCMEMNELSLNQIFPHKRLESRYVIPIVNERRNISAFQLYLIRNGSSISYPK